MADPSESFGPNEASPVPTEDTYARYARSLGITDGVVASTNSFDPADLRVSGNGGTNVTIQAGEANVMGVWYRNSLAITRPVPVNTGSTPRIDTVVLRCNNVANEVTVTYLKGTSTAPALTRNFGTTWDVPLATVTVAAGAATVPSTGVTDRRQFIARGPIAMNTGIQQAPAQVGQLQVRPGRLLMAAQDGSWTQIFPQPDPTWTYFPYTSEIRDYNAGAGSGYYNGAYAKFGDGMVRLRGLVESVSGTAPANVVVARLPVGFRAGASQVFTAYSSSGPVRITVNGDDNATDSGKIRIAAGLASGGWVSLDGIAWWSAQDLP